MPSSAETSGSTGFFVPGRIEVLGKHTDYAGGSSITCATSRGFRLVARPRADGVVRVRSVDPARSAELPIGPDARASGWANYVATVVRRVARNAPGALRGADLEFSSDLPEAAGMSSSSALLVAVFLGLDAASGGRIHDAIGGVVGTPAELAAYLACVENGAAFGPLEGERGVGTSGGSGDHVAILCSSAGRLGRFRYAPFTEEGSWPVPAGQALVVASSGVVAEKTGAAREAYNRASRLAHEAARVFSEWTGRPARHLADALAHDPEAAETIARGAATLAAGARVAGPAPAFDRDELERRIRAFAAETEAVDHASQALAEGNLEAFARAASDSQSAAEELLGNQVPETSYLVRSALRLGAVASSAFGAGFGGSVWALVPTVPRDGFTRAWRADYAAAFPEPSARARFIAESAGAPAARLDGAPIW